ncbi:MAG: AMP-binding protein, partial [Burkholderiales bacterium]
MSVLWKSNAITNEAIIVPGDTMAKMFWNAVQQRGDRVILRQKDFGIWNAVTWRELGEITREAGMGLAALELAPGECVSILANTVKEWMVADLGALGAAGVVNGIYPTDAIGQCEYLINDSSSVFVFVEDEEQLDKILSIRAHTPQLRKIIVFDMEGLSGFSDPQVMSLTELRELGKAYN